MHKGGNCKWPTICADKLWKQLFFNFISGSNLLADKVLLKCYKKLTTSFIRFFVFPTFSLYPLFRTIWRASGMQKKLSNWQKTSLQKSSLCLSLACVRACVCVCVCVFVCVCERRKKSKKARGRERDIQWIKSESERDNVRVCLRWIGKWRFNFCTYCNPSILWKEVPI